VIACLVARRKGSTSPEEVTEHWRGVDAGMSDADDGYELGFLAGGGEMGALIRAHDWRASPLGSPETWPRGLRTAVRIMLTTRHPMYIWWGANQLCFYNDAYRPSIGSERHPGSLGRPAREVWDEIWDVIGPQIEQVMAGGGATWHENQLIPITRNGAREEVYWTYSYGPIDEPAEPNAVGGVLVVCTETTQHVLSARRLAESEERLQLALSGGRGVGTWDWDVPNDRVVADSRFATLYGVDPEKAKAGAPIAEFFRGIHPDDVQRVQAKVAEACRTGEGFSEEYRLVQPDGSWRWVLAEGGCTLAPDGAPLRFPGVSFDISDRKSAERRLEALVTLTDRIRDLDDPNALAFAAARILGETLNVSRAGYGLVDPASETITIERDWNAPGVTSLAGVLQFRDYGSYIEDLTRGETVVIADADHDMRTRDNAEALKAIGAQALVNMPVTEHGGLVALLYLNHAGPRPWSVDDLALIREVAERTRTATERLRVGAALRQSEAQLREANETLETRIAERTAELSMASEALRQSQKMEAVGQLTGGIAHDFNNLLAGISGSLELMDTRLSQGRFEGLARYIAIAQESARRAGALTQRLLAFARRQTLDPKVVDINRTIAGMTELLQRSVGPGVRVEAVQAAGAWTTRLDPSQLENAILNLCINARDAMAPDGGRITVETANKWLDDRAAKERDLPPGQYVSLCVSDTGTGMSPDIIEKVFDPFFTTKPLGQGTGLGLSMIYGFVRQSGGQVRIYSEVGKGTTICLYFPRFLGEASAEEDVDRATIDPGDGEIVLVIDDEPAIRMLLSEVLEDSGYKVIEAEDGPSGLRVLDGDGRIDLLITDVGLPGGLNGRQVADAARARRPQLKVLFITGFAENAAIGNGHLEPGMAVVTKPFAMNDLANKVRDLLAQP
jgi:PAS domain S-box-containing protein